MAVFRETLADTFEANFAQDYQVYLSKLKLVHRSEKSDKAAHLISTRDLESAIEFMLSNLPEWH